MDKTIIVLLIPFGLILLSLVFFSRGILIFLTIICLVLTQTHFTPLGKVALFFRWIFFTLFTLHIFGDIFLGKTVRSIKFFDILAIIFIIYAFISGFYSPYPTLTLERTLSFLALYISVFWIIWKYAYEQGPQRAVNIILRAMMFVFIANYLMLFIPNRAFLLARFRGIFYNPNGLGLLSAIILPLSLWQFLETKKKSALFLFFLILISLLLTGTRGAMNATALALGYFIYARSKKYKPLIFFSSISFILIFIWIIETFIKEIFKVYIRVETIPILGGRLEVWPIALNLIMDKPFFGYGFGVEDRLMELKQIIPRIHAGAYFHNSFLGMLLQLGVPGFIIFFSPLFVLLFKELFSKVRDETMPLLRYALRSSLIAGLISCFYESWIYAAGSAQVFPFWIIIMLLTFYYYRDKEKRTVEGT